MACYPQSHSVQKVLSSLGWLVGAIFIRPAILGLPGNARIFPRLPSARGPAQYREPATRAKPWSCRRNCTYLLLGWSLRALGATTGTPAQFEFFEQRIRPVLVNECSECHGATQQKGGLRVDFRDGLLQGGTSGPTIVAGDAQKSLLLQALQQTHAKLKMPKDRPKLADAVLADFAIWVNQGAVDPRDQPTKDSGEGPANWETTRNTRKDWWSFKPVRDPSVPALKRGDGADHPVDRFLRARLEERGLEPAPQADRQALLRRVTLALTGLPPTPAELLSFINDNSPEAYPKVVNRLLDSPRFGERWARHWMDLVRYCESHGSQGDPELPHAWRYRDYLIRAFNTDVPYDQFVREHLAGDLLPHPRRNPNEGLNESILGTAQLRMVELGFVPVDALDDQVKVVDNQIDVFSKTFLGLTVSCARCHDHKFDPISQKDFYALYGIFASSRPGQVVVDLPEVQATNRAALATLKAAIRTGLANAWRAAAVELPRELQEHTARAQDLARLDTETRRILQEIARLESSARTELAHQKGIALPAELPMPMARWTFEENLQDAMGHLHGRPEGGAVVRGGRLILNGTNAWVVTEPLVTELQEKTLEVWLALANLTQRGGSAFTVQTSDSNIFDAIVFGEREPAHWMAGSDYFNRTRDFGGPAEIATPGELIHLVLVYGPDNSITCYRNGALYGKSYQQGTGQKFAAGSARVVFGKRHLGEGVTALAAEIEEARLYARALTSDEVAASFRSGAPTVDPNTLARFLTSTEHQQWTALHGELPPLRDQQAKLHAQQAASERWTAPLADALKNDANPLHPWIRLSGLQGEAFRAGWQQLATDWKRELANRHAFNQTNFTPVWNLRGADAGRWFMSGANPSVASSPPGEFNLEFQGDRVLRGLFPAGVFTDATTRKHGGVLTSPRFRVETDNISVRLLGEHSMARLVVENYAIGGGGIYPAQVIGIDQMSWVRLDTAYRKGAQAYLEFVTTEDFPNPGLRSGGRPYEDGRAGFGVAEVVFHNHAQPPRELLVPAAVLLDQAAPDSPAALAQLYGRLLAQRVAKWAESPTQLTDPEVSFLDYFVRHDLLPSSLPRLPQVAASVAAYRQREAGIPVPRRAPGVHEAAAFDQPLFQRGQPSQPRDPVPRRFLEMFDGHPYPTTLSGRLELAVEVTDPRNPLTARVLVNRLWHHLFGRGLVATVDNFGRLGEKPTHPELLDYLASRFMKHGWSIKDTLRFLVTSQAYQQSTVPSDAARRLDPGNELLSHARVRRLEAEAIRDGILASSGQLDLKMYGPGVNVHYVGKTEGGGPKGPLDGDRRRSLYQRIRRNAHNSFLEAFDAPKPASTRGKRDATNVPAQSLTLLNDGFVIDQSAKWARSLVAQGLERDERVRHMFMTALGREVTLEELDDARDYLEALAQEYSVPKDQREHSERVWQDFAHSIFCLKEFIYAH